MKLYTDEKADIRGEDWFDDRWSGSPPHTPSDGQAIGTYEAKVEMTTLRKPHLLCFVTKFAANPNQRVVIHLCAS
jgi:hypothetical protein